MALDLAEIRRPPDDDAPRLSYAGALGSGARAELIGLQCAVARLSEHDAERPALEAKLAHLPFEDEWTADLTRAGLVMPKIKPAQTYLFQPPWTYRRGFVEHLFAPAEVLAEHGAALAEAHPIRSLAIDGLTAPAAKALAEQSWLAGVDSLSTGAAVGPLATLLKSRHLRLAALRVSLAGGGLSKVLALPAVAELRTLVVDVPDDRAVAAAALADGAPTSLESLRFESRPNNWGSPTGQRGREARSVGGELARMLLSPRLARLRSLAVDELDVEAASALGAHPAMEEVTVTALADAAGVALVTACLGRLRCLRLDWIGRAAGELLCRSSAPQLEELTLKRWLPPEGENGFLDAPLDLSTLDAPRLRSLRLVNCGWSPAVIDGLHARRSPQITCLSVSDNHARATHGLVERLVAGAAASRWMSLGLACGPAALADVEAVASARLLSLRRLALRDAPREAEADAGIAALARSTTLSRLLHLDYFYAGNHPSFGPAGAEALLSSSTPIQVLYINPAGLTAATRRKLEARATIYPGSTWTTDWLPFICRGCLAVDATAG